jgi:hypothetical protein
MKNCFYKLEIDSPIETYELLSKYIPTVKDVPGLVCEIGLRRGGGTVRMIDAFTANNDTRIYVCIDPYGNIIYNDIVGAHRSDYTDTMKNETVTELFRLARDRGLNIQFFNLEDSEFYKRFPDGVPIYNEVKTIEDRYCCVHVDGQHDLKSVMEAAEFFNSRISANGVIFFDNTDHYNHGPVHEFLLGNGFHFLEDIFHKKAYRKG